MNYLYVCVGMSADYCDECNTSESSSIKKSNEKKMKLSLLCLFFQTEVHLKTNHLSLLNHSNLFLSMPKIYIFHKLLQGILQWIGLRMIPIVFLATPSLWRCTHTLWQKIKKKKRKQKNCRSFTIKQISCCVQRHTQRERVVSIYFTLVIYSHSAFSVFSVKFPFELNSSKLL